MTLEERLALAATVYENTTEAIFVTDAQTNIISINASFTSVTGYTEDQALGKTPKQLLSSGYHDAQFFHEFWTSLEENGTWQGEMWNKHSDSRIFPVWQSITAVKDSQGHTIQYVSIFHDISQCKSSEHVFRYRANYDALTDLPNRNLFQDRMALAIRQARRTGKPFALLLMDLDRFKWINDTLGHKAGDTVLKTVAQRLSRSIRNSDTVARLGGDEFTVILPELAQKSDAKVVAEKIFTAFAEPVDIDGNEVSISASFGIAIYPTDGEDSDTLQKNADNAMYFAKESGRNRYYYFTPELLAEEDRRITLINHMRKAIEQDEFSIVYLPVIDISNNQITGAEALIRWQQPELGIVSPYEFIPLAEESRLIQPISNWILKRIAQDMRDWQDSGLKPIQISINQSATQFSLGACDEEWKMIFAEHNISLSDISVEITEAVFMEKGNQSTDILSKMQSMGILVTLDDFGTGYSSLSHLKRFPVDIIKIDREFISDITSDTSAALLVETIITLAEKMQIKVIAEGVETEQQLSFLQQHQCRYVQGYYFSKPLLVDELKSYFLAH